jgi:CRISPR type I-E-associated protein CasB/Cse2
MRSKLANSSRGIEDPDVWIALFADIDPALVSRKNSGEASTSELAIVTALTLFAKHHRINDSAQIKDVSLGTALGRLFRSRGGSGSEDAAKWSYYRQMISAFKSHDTSSQIIPISRVVRLIIAEKSIGLDYARLASDIINLSNPQVAHAIQLSWGRDYWNVINGFSKPQDSSSTEPSTTEKEGK